MFGRARAPRQPSSQFRRARQGDEEPLDHFVAEQLGKRATADRKRHGGDRPFWIALDRACRPSQMVLWFFRSGQFSQGAGKALPGHAERTDCQRQTAAPFRSAVPAAEIRSARTLPESLCSHGLGSLLKGCVSRSATCSFATRRFYFGPIDPVISRSAFPDIYPVKSSMSVATKQS